MDLMKIKGELVLREVCGEFLLIPVDSGSAVRGIVSLNEAAAAVWQGIEAGKTVDEIVSAITDEYDVTADEARADINEIIEGFRNGGLVE